MGKPRMIILVRHAQSEGNKNRDIHQTTPDHRVKLTAEGLRQAQEAGRRLRDLLRPDDNLHFFTSPYRRTRETTEGILESLTSDSPSPSPFPRNTIKVYEEPRLREQDFGNFQPCSTEMERMWMERADYGHFFYRIPNGESAADAYDRVSGFNESLWRLFGEDDFASVCVLVTHGLMTRVFLMKWYHWSVEYFEDLRNIDHCEFVIMTHNEDNGKYNLQNKLRTWSEMRKERDLEKKNERELQGLSPTGTTPTEHIPIRRKWGMIESLRHENGTSKSNGDPKVASSTSSNDTDKTFQYRSNPFQNPNNPSRNSLSDHSQSNPHPEVEASEANRSNRTGDSSSDNRTSSTTRPMRPHMQGLHRDSDDHHLHTPPVSSSTACFKLALLHLGGRDGGGSMSGANSLAPSDDEGDDHGSRSLRPVSGQFHPRPTLHRPSQEIEDDGDDELSANPTEDSKRFRAHHHYLHHHHHHHQPVPLQNSHSTHHRQTSSTTSSQPHHRMANILGDGDDVSTHSDSHTPESSHIDVESPVMSDKSRSSGQEKNHSVPESVPEISLEEQQRQDQSIRGSVY
ncbi:Histidine phosphatase superfamily clade-1 [Penicillium angulare]|uniref:Histidine phosphatase superfamily clade-1 n=1 Tax=Penicillium angulare TaxID=116970 RepID=UPI002541BD6F|nr:Histidine phosphatase superfamily clade-1 [Penicillium angulare]KAJ5287513.1 Histidine phosphatase superfamily clade-1 [Penicillium angulare]